MLLLHVFGLIFHSLSLSGDTLYYKFMSDMSNTEWGYKFTVTGGYRGRFQTGTVCKNNLGIDSLIEENLAEDSSCVF